jgi:hypothetical protein
MLAFRATSPAVFTVLPAALSLTCCCRGLCARSPDPALDLGRSVATEDANEAAAADANSGVATPELLLAVRPAIRTEAACCCTAVAFPAIRTEAACCCTALAFLGLAHDARSSRSSASGAA